MSRCQRECHRFEPDILLQHAAIALAVERILGKDEVMSSNLIGSTKLNNSMSAKLPIICYHPGARGDFLNSVLYGNRLFKDQNNKMVHEPGGIRVEKIHWYKDTISPVQTKSDFKKYMSIQISVNTLQEQKEVAWLMLVKHSEFFNCKIGNNQWSLTVDVVKTWMETFRDVKFDVVVPFKNVFCINYLSQLCADLSLPPLTNEETLRIQKNININLDILNSSGPW